MTDNLLYHFQIIENLKSNNKLNFTTVGASMAGVVSVASENEIINFFLQNASLRREGDRLVFSCLL